MEGFILMIIIALISSYLGNNNHKKEQKSMPPFKGKQVIVAKSKQTINEEKTTSLDDFARDVFEKLEEKIESKHTDSLTIQTDEEEVNISKPKDINKDVDVKTVQNQNMVESKTAHTKKEKEVMDFIPTSKNALVQVMITSEIIGPPVSKRRSS